VGRLRPAAGAWRAVPEATRVWGAIALAVFAVAFWLTQATVHTAYGVAKPYLLELTGDASADSLPQRVTITPTGQNATLTAYVSSDVHTLGISSLEAGVGLLQQLRGCAYRPPNSQTLADVGEIRSRVLSFSQERLFDLSTLPYLNSIARVRPIVTCDLPRAVLFETYTTRAMDFGWLATAAEPVVERAMGRQELDFRVDIAADGAEDMRVTDLDRGTQVLATSFLVGPHHSARYRVTWTSIVQAEHRDINLVIIGSLVAVGAAAVIEALRPLLIRDVR